MSIAKLFTNANERRRTRCALKRAADWCALCVNRKNRSQRGPTTSSPLRLDEGYRWSRSRQPPSRNTPRQPLCENNPIACHSTRPITRDPQNSRPWSDASPMANPYPSQHPARDLGHNGSDARRTPQERTLRVSCAVAPFNSCARYAVQWVDLVTDRQSRPRDRDAKSSTVSKGGLWR